MEMDDNDASGFCSGSGMAMFMTGFSSAFAKKNTCITLYLDTFTLDTAAKFVAAMFGVLALGILAEALVAVRRSRAEKGVAGRFEAALGYGLQQVTPCCVRGAFTTPRRWRGVDAHNSPVDVPTG